MYVFSFFPLKVHTVSLVAELGVHGGLQRCNFVKHISERLHNNNLGLSGKQP